MKMNKRRLLAGVLALALCLNLGVTSVLADGTETTRDSGAGSTQDSGETTRLVVAFAELADEEKYQAVPAKTPLSALILPGTLAAKLEGITGEQTITGVTWEPDTAYDNQAETGTYTFTACLPEGYGVTQGVSLPEIYVMVGAQTLTMAGAQEWDGTTPLSGGQWKISAGKNITITNDVTIQNGAVLTIDPAATFTVTQGILSVVNSTINGTVVLVGDGVIQNNRCNGGIMDFYGNVNASVENVIVRGGTMWLGDGAAKSLTVESGLADIYRNARVDEAVNSGGTLYTTNAAVIKSLITKEWGYSECGKGGRIDTAVLTGNGSLYCWYDSSTGTGGSIGTIKVSEGSKLTVAQSCSVGSVELEFGSVYNSAYPLVENYGEIETFTGSGGYVQNYGTVDNVTLTDLDNATWLGVDFRNGDNFDKSGTVDALTLEYGYFFNHNNSVLNTADLYDTALYQMSTQPITEVRMLESKKLRPNEGIPDGGELIIWEDSSVDTVRLSHGVLTMRDYSHLTTLAREVDCVGVVDKSRFAEIENELTGMVAVSWETPANGSIEVTYDGKELKTGNLIPKNAAVAVSAEPDDAETYKLKVGSLKANDSAITAGSYTVAGDTTFTAEFILNAVSQPWDGTASITVADTYEVTTPVVITEARSICADAVVYVSGRGSITVQGTGTLSNSGTIHGSVVVTGSERRSAGPRLVNSAAGALDACTIQSGGTAENNGTLKNCTVAGGTLMNTSAISKLLLTKNGTVTSTGANAKIETASIESGSLLNTNNAEIAEIAIKDGSVENRGATIKVATLEGGRLKNSADGAAKGSIGKVNASGGRLENAEGCTIEELSLTEDHNVVLENKGEITKTEGTITTSYELTDRKLILTENAYFNGKTATVGVKWTPVKAIGTTATAPVRYEIKFYDNNALAGDAAFSATYLAGTTTGGAYGLKFDTTYYVTLKATVAGGNVDVGKVLEYETLTLHTVPLPEELGAINVDRITLAPGESFQFVALNKQGKPVISVPIEWSVQAGIDDKLTSRATNISANGLLTVGADEQAENILVGCHREDGYLTTYTADVTISRTAPTKYSITVNATQGGTANASVVEAEEGAYVLLFAQPDSGYRLERWTTTAGEITTYGIQSAFTALRMPAQAVTVTAHFGKISTSGSGSGKSNWTPVSDLNVIDSPQGGSSALNAVTDAVNKALESGLKNVLATVTFRNFDTLLVEGLQTINDTAAQLAKEKNVNIGLLVNFDRVVDGDVLYRIKLDPKKLATVLTADLPLGAHIAPDDADVLAVKELFAKHYSNSLTVIVYDEQKPLGVNAEFAAKLALSGMNTKTLYVYSYDLTTNKYTRIYAPSFFVDANGYAHVTAPLGGAILLTDRPLTAK